jgi:hypothetical protein
MGHLMVVTLLLLHVEGLAIEHARMTCPLALGIWNASAADYIQNHCVANQPGAI